MKLKFFPIQLSVENLLTRIAELEGYIWYYTPDHEVVFNDGSKSNTISLTRYCTDVTGTDYIERYNNIIVKGGWQ